MKPVARHFVVAAFFALPVAATAEIGGPWCSDAGLMIWIDPEMGIWFEEQTRCDSVPLPDFGPDGRWSAELSCRTFHVTAFRDDGSVETFEDPLPEITRIVITRHDNAHLTVELPPQPAFAMVDCDLNRTD